MQFPEALASNFICPLGMLKKTTSLTRSRIERYKTRSHETLLFMAAGLTTMNAFD